MDIIGCRFQEVMYQQTKHMARVNDLYRERVSMFFIVTVSLLSGETVPTKNLKFKNLLGYNFHFKTPS